MPKNNFTPNKKNNNSKVSKIQIAELQHLQQNQNNYSTLPNQITNKNPFDKKKRG